VQFSSVSCASAGNCSAGGSYLGSSSLSKPFVVNEVNGTWHTAIEVPGMAALTTGSVFSEVVSLSCSSAGNCSAGGWYTDSSDHTQPFVVDEVNGTWHNAIKVPGITTLNQDGDAAINAMSCAPRAAATPSGSTPTALSTVSCSWSSEADCVGVSPQPVTASIMRVT